MSEMNLNRRDLEALSAYLDDALSARELTKLEKRLTTDAELREALAALRQTRAALRAAPQARAPRSFALTPEMIGHVRRGMSFIGSLRAVSALASFLFVVLIAGDLWLGVAQPLTSESQAASLEAVAEAPAAAAEVFTEKSADAPLPPEPTMGANAPAIVENADVEEAGADEADESAYSADNDDAMGEAEAAPAGGSQAVMSTATSVAAEEGANDMRIAEQTATASPTPEPSLTPTSQPTPTLVPAVSEILSTGQPWLRMGAILMASVALIAGSWAWWLRKH